MSAPKPLPTYDELHRLFSYDQETGDLVRKIGAGQRGKIGDIVGCINGKKGYRRVVIAGDHFYVHCIIWKMMTGDDPPAMVDHEDGNNLNNRWRNLRLASNGQNIQNSRLRCDNTSGVKGVSWDLSHQKWSAHVTVNKRQIKLGRFKQFEDAEAAVINARLRLHGEFSRFC